MLGVRLVESVDLCLFRWIMYRKNTFSMTRVSRLVLCVFAHENHRKTRCDPRVMEEVFFSVQIYMGGVINGVTLISFVSQTMDVYPASWLWYKSYAPKALQLYVPERCHTVDLLLVQNANAQHSNSLYALSAAYEYTPQVVYYIWRVH